MRTLFSPACLFLLAAGCSSIASTAPEPMPAPHRPAKIADGVCLLPEDRRHNTDWFKDAGHGIFVHYLEGIQNGRPPLNMGKKTDWDACVRDFDTEKFAEDAKACGAKYVIFTMMQCTRYMAAPNATYDRLTGYKPGEACATRDIVEDLYASLHKRGIVLMLYWTGDGPRKDEKAATALGYDKATPVPFVRNWAQIVAEYGERYGDKVAGWWVDGCYSHSKYNEEKWSILATALRRGNPKRIIALNNPSMTRANSGTLNDDYTTGEVGGLGEIPKERWRDGVQWHVLTYLGSHWGSPGLRFTPQKMADYIGKCNAAGGVVTLDVGLMRDGSIDPKQVAALSEASRLIEQSRKESANREKP